MAHGIAVVSLSVLLAVAALVWKSWTPRPDKASAATVSLSIHDMMLKANTQRLPDQEIEDRTMVFVSADSQ